MKNTFATMLAGAALLADPAFAQEAAPEATSPHSPMTADADGESLFAEMLSRQNSVEDVDKMFAKVFSGHRGDLLLEAGVVLREDGNPAIELEPNAGKVTVSIRIAVNDKAWNAWVSDAQKRFEEMSEKSEPAETSRDIYWDGPKLVVGERRFFFKKDYEPTIGKQLESVPKPQWVRVALVDKAGWTIAAEYVDLNGSPLDCYHTYGRVFYGNYDRVSFTVSAPVSCNIVFEGLSLSDLKATAKIICLVGDRNELVTTGTDKSLNYRKTHPNKRIKIGKTDFSLSQLSPRLMVGTTEVTRALWETVMGEKPSWRKKANPVENVSWDDCQAFLKKLNARPEVRESGLVFRLPLQGEWEFACRAGATGRFCKLADGTEISKKTLGRVAWFTDIQWIMDNPKWKIKERKARHPHPVGQKEPNAFGLYDMLGNVAEFSNKRLYLGGHSLSDVSSDSQYACRPDTQNSGIGFRLFASSTQN